QLDDNLNTNGGLNNTSDDATQPQITAGAGDFAYGGGGLHGVVGNSGLDRLYALGGGVKTLLVPLPPCGGAHGRAQAASPNIISFLTSLSIAGGADTNLTDPNLIAQDVEIGMFDQSSPLWQQNHGAPRDPQPGNNPQGTFDNAGSPENDTLQTPLQTSAG